MDFLVTFWWDSTGVHMENWSESGVKLVSQPRIQFVYAMIFFAYKSDPILSPESRIHPDSGLDSRLRIGAHFRFRMDRILMENIRVC
jgi:hypothetical protein